MTDHRGASGDAASKPAGETAADAHRLLSTCRHELRTPINAIQGFSDLLLDDQAERADAGLLADVRQLRTGGRRLLAIVDELLADAVVTTPREVVALTRMALRRLRPVADEVAALGEQRLAQARAAGDEAVADDLTEIVGAARRLGGSSAWVEDLLAPHLAGELPVPELPAPPGPTPEAGGEAAALVLVVDDLAVNRELLVRHLAGWGYRTVTADSGAAALECLTALRPDLILLDVLMPGLGGYEVCRRLQADPATRDIPVIFVTALENSGDESHGLALGAVDFITKPVNPAILRARVRTHVALAEHRRHLEALVARRTCQLRQSRLDILWRLGKAGELRDEDTGYHVVRVSLVSRLLAQGLGLPDDQVERIFLASPLHDVGKIGIPDGILLKPGRLTDDEWVVMRRHAELGAAILRDESAGFGAWLQVSCEENRLHDANPLLDTAATIALSHHERWDGQGYPSGLAGEAIPIEGRVVAVADVFDSLSSRRPYKPSYPHERVMRMVREATGKHFDPAVVAVLERCADELREILRTYREDSPPAVPKALAGD